MAKKAATKPPRIARPATKKPRDKKPTAQDRNKSQRAKLRPLDWEEHDIDWSTARKVVKQPEGGLMVKFTTEDSEGKITLRQEQIDLLPQEGYEALFPQG